ncbi:MAG TPA: hypothetical protein VF861_13625 [Telluria sp.]
MSATSAAPLLTPPHVTSAVDSASVLANHCPGVCRSLMFPTTADKVVQILKPATDYIHQQTGETVIQDQDTTLKMVRVVRATLLEMELPSQKTKKNKPRGFKI